MAPLSLFGVIALVTHTSGRLPVDHRTERSRTLPVSHHLPTDSQTALAGSLGVTTLVTDAHILIVDDDQPSRSMMAELINRQGFRVSTASSVQHALRAIESDPPDLVVTDLYLDNALGHEVAEFARSCNPTIPVVLVTGRPSFDNAQQALKNHVSDILSKPIEPDGLVGGVRRALWASRIERKAMMLAATNQVLETVMPRVIEAKDPTTSGHSQRVVNYVERLAISCKVDEADLEPLRLAALLHDVGKVGTPSSILTKQGPLTAEERKIVQGHPEIGYQILSGLEDMEKVGLWVYQHHERWDGSGYPNGLARDEVLLPGRILVLAEVYDALAEPRSYKPAWPNERIVAFFRSEAGKHFDPDLAHLVADGLEKQGKRFFAPQSGLLF